MSQPNLKLYFDGLCILCSKEMSIYKNADKLKQLEFVDISAPTFDAGALGLDPIEVNKNFHVQIGNELKFTTGVDAFIEIWKRLPGWKWIASIASFSPCKFILKLFYKIFVVARPYLPRRDDCEAGNCKI